MKALAVYGRLNDILGSGQTEKKARQAKSKDKSMLIIFFGIRYVSVHTKVRTEGHGYCLKAR
jgi:hypothetical protein